MYKYARILNEEILKQGAKTVFYLTWARQNIPQMQDGETRQHRRTMPERCTR